MALPVPGRSEEPAKRSNAGALSARWGAGKRRRMTRCTEPFTQKAFHPAPQRVPSAPAFIFLPSIPDSPGSCEDGNHDLNPPFTGAIRFQPPHSPRKTSSTNPPPPGDRRNPRRPGRRSTAVSRFPRGPGPGAGVPRPSVPGKVRPRPGPGWRPGPLRKRRGP